MKFCFCVLKSVIIASTAVFVEGIVIQHERYFRRQVTGQCPLYSTSPNNLSAAEKERREEDKRRKERKDDVIPGKTSAINGATDYSIDVKSTTEQYLRQASQVEQEIYRMTELGMEMIRTFRLNEAAKAFDRVFEIKPNAYLWQAGIAKFYLGDLDSAIEIFSRCASIYESRFEEIASEERIWGNAALLKKLSLLNRKDRKNLSQPIIGLNIPGTGNSDFSYQLERRKVVRLALGLFESSVNEDLLTTIVSRAKLRSIGGSLDSAKPTMDYKLWKISSWYYLGLHYDVIGDYPASKICMKTALRLRPNARSDDLIHNLPMLHMTYRNWFDDDAFDFEADDELLVADSDDQEKSLFNQAEVDPVIVESLRSSLMKARIVDLQKILRHRGLRPNGSKLELKDRLLESLINDTELLS